MRFLYFVLRLIIKFVLKIFFKRRIIYGLENIKPGQPTIITGNHNSQFMDAAVLMASIPHELYMIAAKSSTQNKWLRIFSYFLNWIPTERPIDKKFAGSGYIMIQDDNTIKGKGTNFVKECKKKDVLVVNSTRQQYLIKEVLSHDTVKCVKIKRRMNQVKTDLDLSTEQFHHYTIIPKLQQANVYKKVY